MYEYYAVFHIKLEMVEEACDDYVWKIKRSSTITLKNEKQPTPHPPPPPPDNVSSHQGVFHKDVKWC